MTEEISAWKAVDLYHEDIFGTPDPGLEAALAAAESAGLPAINVTPGQGRFLHVLARALKAERILEVGTLGGYSSIWLARALPPGGRLVTLEAEPRHAEVATAAIAGAGLADVVEVRLGRGLDTMASLEDEGAVFDFVFIDADKETYPEYLEHALRLTRVGGVIVADNVVRHGEVANAESRDPRVQGVRRFNELVAAEARLVSATLQVVSGKGHDGFAIAVVVA